MNGEGTEINQDKEKFIGMFINGKKNGNGILYDKNGNIIKSGVWESNEFVSDFKNWGFLYIFYLLSKYLFLIYL